MSLLRGATPEQLFAVYGREVDEGLIDLPQVFADGVVLPTGDARRNSRSPTAGTACP